MKYDDLLTVPYKRGGRGMDGMDCYGYAMECFRRNGQRLKDLAADPGGDLGKYLATINAREVERGAFGLGVQSTTSEGLHIGFLLSSRIVTHMTTGGPRVTPVFALGPCRYFEVID